MLEGIPGADNAEARKRGFLAAVAEAPGIEVVASQTGRWEMDRANEAFANVLTRRPDISGLFCANDMMALGAIRAIEAAGKTGKIVVTSYDNLEAARDEI